MEIYKKQTLAETFSVYFDHRMIKILLLGAISGFPWVIIGSSLSLWLKEDGLSRSTIGWAGLIFAVYAFNYLGTNYRQNKNSLVNRKSRS